MSRRQSCFGIALLFAALFFCAPQLSAQVYTQLASQSPYFCVIANDGSSSLQSLSDTGYLPLNFGVAASKVKSQIAVLRKQIQLLKSRAGRSPLKRKTALILQAKNLQMKHDELRRLLVSISGCQNRKLHTAPSVAIEYRVITYKDANGNSRLYGGAFLATDALIIPVDDWTTFMYGENSAWCVAFEGENLSGFQQFETHLPYEDEYRFVSDPCLNSISGPQTCPDFFGKGRIGMPIYTFVNAKPSEEALIMNEAAVQTAAISAYARPKPPGGCAKRLSPIAPL